MAWYDKKWVIMLFLVILWPIGLLMMWRSPTFSTKTKGLVTAFFVFIFVLGVFNKTPSQSTTQAPPAATKAEDTTGSSVKPSKPEIKRPERSFMNDSYHAIEEKTGLYATDSWLLEYSESVALNGNIQTHGFVELNSDGIKHQFWCLFDGKTEQILRVKIDSTLVFTAIGW